MSTTYSTVALSSLVVFVVVVVVCDDPTLMAFNFCGVIKKVSYKNQKSEHADRHFSFNFMHSHSSSEVTCCMLTWSAQCLTKIRTK